MKRYLVFLLLCFSVFAFAGTINREKANSSSAAFCQTADAPDAFRLSLKEGRGDAVEIVFVSNPVVTYDEQGDLVVTVNGQSTTYALADVRKMTFFRSDTATSILSAFDGDGDQNGIYTIDGRQTDSIKARGLYIIKGRKVLVK